MRHQPPLVTLLTAALLTLAASHATAQDALIPTVDELARLAASAASTGNRALLHDVGMQQIESEDFAGAIGTLQALRELCPRSVAISNNLAVALAATGDYATALRELEQLAGTPSTVTPLIADTAKGNRGTIAKARQFWQDKDALPVTDAVDLRLLDDIDSCPGLSPPPLPAPPPEAREESLELAPSEQADDDAPSDEGASGEGEPAEEDDEELDPVVDAILEAVGAWADAWEGQQVDAYLAAYSDHFTPADGTSRAAWAERKRRLIGDATSIEVIVGDEGGLDEVLKISDTVGKARFRQTYRSNTFSDVVNKTLMFALEDGAWKIISETSEPIPE